MTWSPLLADLRTGRPDPGDLIASAHTVWRVIRVEDLDLDDNDTAIWISAGMPAEWTRRPYRVTFEYVAGARPSWAAPGKPVGRSGLDVRGGNLGTWYVYRESGRWPMCSCCGEPMPCRAELRDKAVTAGAAKLEMLSRRGPGDCWHCGEPVTHRHKAVTYPGDNLDLPIGPTVKFHLRKECRPWAERYEERWIAADPRRERILTYPGCGGSLIVHHDGSSECHPRTDKWSRPAAPDCQGHTTHDHTGAAACYVYGPCPRGCLADETHPGITHALRPERRDERTPL